MTSAGNSAFEAISENFPVISTFEDVFVSAVEKCMKPDVMAFERFLKRNTLSPDECLFIDDSAKNVDAALTLGIAAIRFENAGLLRFKLGDLGLLGERVHS